MFHKLACYFYLKLYLSHRINRWQHSSAWMDGLDVKRHYFFLFYGSESWPARGRGISKITASEMKCLPQISGKTKRDLIRNQKIREDLQQPPIVKRLAQRQLRWFGHLSRINEDSKPRQFF